MVGIISRDRLKRTFDVLLASLGLVLLSPFMGLIAVAIRLTEPGPIFYSSPKVGLGGKIFNMFKFRSMVNGADNIGSLVTANDDRRITPIRCYLRRTKLEELHTLIKVLQLHDAE